MAKSLVTENGTVYIPGGYASYKVQSNPGGLATTGVLLLVGEADAGPAWSLESDLEANAFGPDSLADVVSKYKSGPLVDAFKGIVSPANDADIIGSFSRAVLLKTNLGTKASSGLLKVGGGSYGTLYDKSYGKLGNLTSFSVASAQAEALPTTSAFTYIPAVGTVAYNLRVNGGAAVTGGTLSANTTPTALVSALDALTGVAASGGVNRAVLSAATGTLTLTAVSGNNITLTRSVAFDGTPTIGDTLVIPAGAPAGLRDPAGGATDENVGAYVITNVASTVLTATKLSDAGRGGASIGVITAPATTAAVSIGATTDIVVYSPVTVALEAGAVIDGRGKSLEFAELTSGTDLLSRTAFVLGTITPVSWVSKASAGYVLGSGAEYKVTLAVQRSTDNISESYTVGGEIPLRIGYEGTTGTVTITDTTLTTSVAGGTGTNLSITLADFPTIQSLRDYIASQTGYSAAVGTATLGLLSPVYLDNVTAEGIASTHPSLTPGRIKVDGYRFWKAISDGSSLVQLGNPSAQANSGLPAVKTLTFLSGGLKGATSNTDVTNAITALESVQGNFLVTLFSRDASADIADGLTDTGSTYDIASVNAASKSHVLAMSQFKRRRNRQALSSIQAAFATQKDAAANTASFRVNMAFQNPKDVDSAGNLKTFQPWMLAAKAAAMQAAGFYKSIENKGINISGLVHSAGDFNEKSDSQMEEALLAGLMPARKSPTGGYTWVSDQTTYGKDNNFVFNSLQAVYAADTVALTAAQRMERAIVGQSVADVNKNVAMTLLENIMADMLRLKLIAPSDDAKRGYRNAKIRIAGNAMLVSLEIKLATAISFVAIDFLVAPVEQST
jgi:hypothetical protein